MECCRHIIHHNWLFNVKVSNGVLMPSRFKTIFEIVLALGGQHHLSNLNTFFRELIQPRRHPNTTLSIDNIQAIFFNFTRDKLVAYMQNLATIKHILDFCQ